MYRYGTSARPMFKEIDKISEKWEKNNIQCRFPKHGRTNDLELSYKYTQSMQNRLSGCNSMPDRKFNSFLINSFLMPSLLRYTALHPQRELIQKVSHC